MSPCPSAPLCVVCVPWFKQDGLRCADSLLVQSKTMAEARRLGACPIAPSGRQGKPLNRGNTIVLHA